MTSTLGISQPRFVDLPPPTLQTIPKAIGKNIAIARARTRSRITAVFTSLGQLLHGGRLRLKPEG